LPDDDQALLDRLSEHGVPWSSRVGYSASGALVDVDRSRWERAVDPYQIGSFARRLAWADQPDEVQAAPTARESAPAWVSELERIRAAFGHREFLYLPDAARDVPFADLLWPIASDALQRTSLPIDAGALISAEAQIDAAVALVMRLSQLTTLPLAAMFAEQRNVTALELRLSRDRTEPAERIEYAHFCGGIAHAALEPLLDRFPVLGRLLATATYQWREGFSEMWARLQRDRELLESAFGVPLTASITRVLTDLSDPHAGGRRVHIIEFDGGSSVVYKPKDLRLDQTFGSIVQTISAYLADDGLPDARVMACGAAYGYCERLTQSAQPNTRSAAFFRNAGRLIAVLYIVGGSDCHYQNVFIRDHRLVLIDAETILEARLRPLGNSEVPDFGDGKIKDSVLRVGLLPSWMSMPGGSAVDISGLGALSGASGSISPNAGGWKSVNTDDMMWSDEALSAFETEVGPLGEQARVQLAVHIDDLVAGFTEVYELCTRSKIAQEIQTLLRNATGATRRVVVRPTRIYAAIQENACTAEALSSWNERMLRLEQLSRAFISTTERPLTWGLLGAELESLEQLDVPRFEQLIGTGDIVLDGKVVAADGFESDGLADALRRIESLSEQDLAWQTALIRGAVAAGVSDRSVIPAESGTSREPPGHTGTALADAGNIVNALLASAHFDGDGVPTWFTTSPFGDDRHLHFGLIGDGLYDGRAGVAAFLYAAGADELASATLRPVLESINGDDRAIYLRSLGMGMTGVGGLLRTLLFLHERRLGTESWLDVTRCIVTSLTSTILERAPESDLVGGLAGLAAPLSRLWLKHGEDRARDLLGIVADCLIVRRSETGAWRNAQKICLTGLAHGASGVALALAEAEHVYNSGQWIDGVRSGSQYERQELERGDGRGWEDLRWSRSDSPPSYMHAWCHGSVGISLARARLLALLPSDTEAGNWVHDLELAMQHSFAEPPLSRDHLCCGELGRAVVLAAVGRERDRGDWVETALRLQAECRQRAAERGTWSLIAVDDAGILPVPGLMTGLSGIGMCLLGQDAGPWIDALLT
jgi:type 2 lantibiotic biosynthesis protein LanM